MDWWLLQGVSASHTMGAGTDSGLPATLSLIKVAGGKRVDGGKTLFTQLGLVQLLWSESHKQCVINSRWCQAAKQTGALTGTGTKVMDCWRHTTVSNKMDFSHLREINSGLSLCPNYPQSQSTSSDWQPRPPSNFTTQNLKLFPPPAVLIGYFILWCHIVTFNILGLWIVSRLLSSCMLQENFMLQWAEG